MRVSEAVGAALPAILETGNTGVVLAWVTAAGRLNTHQGQCCVVSSLMLMLHMNLSRAAAAGVSLGGWEAQFPGVFTSNLSCFNFVAVTAT